MKKQPPAVIERDRHGRPLIDGTAYTRASTLAKTLDDQTALISWAARMAVLGMSRNPDLVSLAATTDPDDKRTLNDIARRAQDRAGASSGRDTGTSIHAATEMVDYGEDVTHLPDGLLRDARAYQSTCRTEMLRPVLAETFVADEHTTTAGSFDRLLWDDAAEKWVIGDIKTGSSPDPAYVTRYSGLSWAIQLAVYSRCRPWDQEWLTWGDLGAGPPDPRRGVVFYIPRGSGECHALWLNLDVGWQGAQLAAAVRDLRNAEVAA